jgi:hypothetical protein
MERAEHQMPGELSPSFCRHRLDRNVECELLDRREPR